ncbi:hypothetical protein [Siccibacter colletis]|uniref:hypothetical protein n=1 Tax=Siccibacter colletis TaxID=1505757 RepID=UPI003CF1F648
MPADGFYMLTASPLGSDKVTTIEVFHFNSDGTFNYMKSINGVAPGREGGKPDGKKIDFNHVSMQTGEWYF